MSFLLLTLAMVLSSFQIYGGDKVYKIGDKGPGGGIVFYITDGGAHGLEAAPPKWKGTPEDPKTQWSNMFLKSVPGTLTAIGSGSANSKAIITQPGHTASAAKLCSDYNGGSLNDWYLPSKDELNEMFKQKAVVGGFTERRYWSSSEGSAQGAWAQHFREGKQSNNNKEVEDYYVRPVRTF